jgi:hypothetical protein
MALRGAISEARSVPPSLGGFFLLSPLRLVTSFDRLAQPLHGEFDGLRREVVPGLQLGLELLFRKALEIFPYYPLAVELSLVNFSRTNGSVGTMAYSRQKSLTRVTDENGPRLGTRAGSMARHGAGLKD